MPALTGTVLFNGVAPGAPRARVRAPASASGGTAVTLDGSDSSSDGDVLVTHHWRQLSGPTVATSDPNRPKLTFVMPQKPESSMRFELEVKDAAGLVDVEEVEIRNH